MVGIDVRPIAVEDALPILPSFAFPGGIAEHGGGMVGRHDGDVLPGLVLILAIQKGRSGFRTRHRIDRTGRLRF